jgi:hypothetical protein
MESIFAMAGIDAQDLCTRWEDGDRVLRLEDVATFDPKTMAPVEPGPEKPKPRQRGPAKKTATRRSTKKADAATGDDG